MDINKEWGVLEVFEIAADTKTALQFAIAIALTEHRDVSHWSKSKDGSLSLSWHEGDKDVKVERMVTEMSDPEKISTMAKDWLDNAEYPKETPDTDGSYKKGFLITMGDFYDVCNIKPWYIVYGK